MASHYKKFVKLLEMWPLSKNVLPGSKDLGQHIRERVASEFQSGKAADINVAECDRIHDSLHRIATNSYAKMYERDFSNTAFQLSREEIRKKFDDLGSVVEESRAKS